MWPMCMLVFCPIQLDEQKNSLDQLWHVHLRTNQTQTLQEHGFQKGFAKSVALLHLPNEKIKCNFSFKKEDL